MRSQTRSTPVDGVRTFVLVVASLWLTVLLAGCAGAGVATPELVPERPGLGPGTDVVAPGAMMTETGVGLLLETGHHHGVWGQGVLRVGIAPGLEFRTTPGSVIDAAPRVSESREHVGTSVGLTARISDAKGWRPDAALTVVMAEDGVGGPFEMLHPAMMLALGWPLGDLWALSSAVELHTATLAPGGGIAALALGIERALRDDLTMAMEVAMGTADEVGGSVGAEVGTTLAWQLSHTLQVDLLGAFSVDGRPGGVLLGVGFSRLWH